MSEVAHKSMLCVGGPRDGKRMAAQAGSGFIVPVLKSPALHPNEHGFNLANVGEVSYTKYKPEFFNTLQGEVSFWVPENQSPLETMTRLLEAYEKYHVAVHEFEGR